MVRKWIELNKYDRNGGGLWVPAHTKGPMVAAPAKFNLGRMWPWVSLIYKQ